MMSERDALRDLCISNANWCATNGWTGGSSDYCDGSWTGLAASGGKKGCTDAGRVRYLDYVSYNGVYVLHFCSV